MGEKVYSLKKYVEGKQKSKKSILMKQNLEIENSEATVLFKENNNIFRDTGNSSFQIDASMYKTAYEPSFTSTVSGFSSLDALFII